MNKDIKEYLPYYIGQEIATKEEKYNSPGLKLIGISDMGCQVRDEAIRLTYYVSPEDCKLKLRPLPDIDEMTEGKELCNRLSELGIQCYNTRSWIIKRVLYVGVPPECIKLLCEQGFDLFGLIEAGLAIDKTNP